MTFPTQDNSSRAPQNTLAGAAAGALIWVALTALVVAFAPAQASALAICAFLVCGGSVAAGAGAMVSGRRVLHGELHELATQDPVTSLPNEYSLSRSLDQALLAPDPNGVTTTIVLFAGLRGVASALSREDTAALLTTLAETLRDVAGPGALLARPDFDRFAVILPGFDSERSGAVCARIVALTSSPIAIGSREVFVDPRVGVSVGFRGDTPDVVLGRAHRAAADAQANGRRIGFFDATLERTQRERHELTEDLRRAVEVGNFHLAFQPIVTAKAGRVVAAEALLRWIDAKRGNVPPLDFIPIAEETGLILPLGRWVLNEACARASQWPLVGSRAVAVTVNVSPIQLRDEGFVEDVRSALEQSGLPSNLLRLEITEGTVLDDMAQTVETIRELSAMGVDTALDDFGTGHSSLAWVQRLPVSCIKIDRAFITDVAEDGVDRAIVRASLYLARALGTDTVAEGVETDAQRQQLIRMGCPYLQGYLFARPQPADVFGFWLQKQRPEGDLTSGPLRHAEDPSTPSWVGSRFAA